MSFSGLRLFFLRNGGQHGLQARQSLRQDSGGRYPNTFHRNPKVLMDEKIPESNDLSPRNLGVLLLKRFWNLVSRLANHLKAPNDGKDGLLIGQKALFSVPFKKLSDFTGILQHVFQVGCGVPFGHSSMASGRMYFAKRGFKADFSTRSTLQPKASCNLSWISTNSKAPIRSDSAPGRNWISKSTSLD